MKFQSTESYCSLGVREQISLMTSFIMYGGRKPEISYGQMTELRFQAEAFKASVLTTT
jgi:hypothetical protein